MEEAFLRSPMQIARASHELLYESPALQIGQMISFLLGLHVVQTSLHFPIPNARGFNHTQNFRFVHRVEDIEMQSAALSLPILPIKGPLEIDVANIEVITGPASALYGPNAFNGALLTTLKDPSKYPGLSVRVQAGINHIANPDRSAAPLHDVQLRYARVWNNRLGLKAALHSKQLAGMLTAWKMWASTRLQKACMPSPVSRIQVTSPKMAMVTRPVYSIGEVPVFMPMAGLCRACTLHAQAIWRKTWHPIWLGP
jgi:hypothetical protein